MTGCRTARNGTRSRPRASPRRGARGTGGTVIGKQGRTHMVAVRNEVLGAVTRPSEVMSEARHEAWAHWPINWSAVWTGALASVATALVLGLIGVAVGAHLLGPENRVVDVKK